jgi:membrane-associated phospholipid phosphatase
VRLHRFLAARFDRRSELGLRFTISLALCCGALWAFSGLLDGVLDNETLVRWDFVVNAWFHAHATAAGLRVFNIVTMLGTVGVGVVIVAAAVWLWRRDERLLLWSWLAVNAGGWLIQLVLKSTVHRARPQYAARYLFGHSYSFPSGHAMQSMVCYPALAILVATLLGWHGARRAWLYVAALAIAVLVAFSRVYLGVHYPSDVLGGLAAGLAWLIACRMIVRYLRNRNGDRDAAATGPA